MSYIKKIVMQGFKSFPRRTEIPLENSMNIIVGPNGSGKSNITDALCFVLGRLSIKSIRAAKAANLIFSGNKTFKGSKEASVEIILDNSNHTFSKDSKEISIKRIVRKTGQSIYKINHQTKTRQDLLELLSLGGIDPNGFNIILQGEIQSLVKSTPEERRKIIEEVAGISIYENRKIKSLRELEKIEERLKEVSSVLKERNSYLRNLEKERQEALSFKNLELTIKRCKATILSRVLKDKESELEKTKKQTEDNSNEISKIKNKILEKQEKVEEFEEKIKKINKQIQKSTSREQDTIHKELSDLKAEVAGLRVREENFENRISEERRKVEEFDTKIKKLEEEFSKIKSSSPKIKEQQSKQKEIESRLDFLEQQRRKFYVLKSDLNTAEHKKDEKEKLLIEIKKEIELTRQSIESNKEEVKYASSYENAKNQKKQSSDELNSILEKINSLVKETLENEKTNAILENIISREEKLKTDIANLENCPLCKQGVKSDHKHKISETSNEKISNAQKKIESNIIKIEKNNESIEELNLTSQNLRKKLNELDIDMIKLKNIEEKEEKLVLRKKTLLQLNQEIKSLEESIDYLRKKFESLKGIEEKYDETKLKLQEFDYRDLDVDTEMSLKTRELNRLKTSRKASIREIEASSEQLEKIVSEIIENEKISSIKEKEEKELYEKFEKLFGEKNNLQDHQKAVETDIIGFQHNIKNFEEKINNGKIEIARILAQLDSQKTEIAEIGNIELLQGSIDQIKEKLQKSQFKISRIGGVNLRSLEVFDKVKEKCAEIEEKVRVIQNEKEGIEKIIIEIDKKKRKTFSKTLDSVNEFFTRNFTQLSRKGSVTLELENKKEPFEGGLNILIRVSRGKYFDITSLSGGEKTLVALSLIFAIQEYRPYSFYIFDEIDAALDKHNSELLATLIKRYMKSGHYIIITHNDILINEATNLYGVSMQDNISKIISLKI